MTEIIQLTSGKYVLSVLSQEKKKCQSLVRTWKEKTEVQRKSNVTHQKKSKLLNTEGEKQERTTQENGTRFLPPTPEETWIFNQDFKHGF